MQRPQHPEWPDTILGIFLVTMVVICTVAFNATRVHAHPDTIPALQAQTDEGQTLALERQVNLIRQSYRQPERVPSGKLRSVARFWAVAYTPLAVDVESTKLAGVIFETIKVSEFNPAPAPYYAVFDELGPYSPDAIAAYWHAALYRFWIYETPSHAWQGCHYRFDGQKTRAFCIFADTLPEQLSPMPFMATPRPFPTPTPRYGR